jgi:CheY-like chemotaxis protein
MKKHILIVDDEKIIRTVLKRILLNSGFSAEVANNGNDALKKIKSKNFDLILLDILMPEMNGLVFMKKLKELKTSAKILVISACHDQSLIKQVQELGAQGYIKKPFDNIDQISNAIVDILK